MKTIPLDGRRGERSQSLFAVAPSSGDLDGPYASKPEPTSQAESVELFKM